MSFGLPSFGICPIAICVSPIGERRYDVTKLGGLAGGSGCRIEFSIAPGLSYVLFGANDPKSRLS
jgi:hypothetical protein